MPVSALQCRVLLFLIVFVFVCAALGVLSVGFGN